ncbi:MAG TPA: hypothetical protein VFG59_13915 [Anaeromyxobacter sp.]|nr:hypothetical protein [Anaeromyxobacter sp.]
MLPALLLALSAAAPEGGLAEEVVAVVRNPAGAQERVITLTRLTDEARIALVARGAVEAAFRPIDGQALEATLEWVLDQTLLADEAARLQIAEVSREEAASELRRFQGRFPDAATYARFLASSELTEEEVTAVLARILRVDRYLDRRIGRGGAVSDEEVQRYAKERGLKAESRAAQDAIRARVGEERVEAAVRAHLGELRGRADIRIIDPDLASLPGEGS